MKVSFITTVYNEKDTIIPFLESLEAQTRVPDEIVIVDGGSSDGTYGLIKDFFKGKGLNFNLKRVPGSSISRGRNKAISIAGHNLICVSDAGCILDRGWVSKIIEGVKNDRIIGGYNTVIAKTFLEKLLASAIMPKKSQIKKENYMPSSRNLCFFKSAWEKAGKYPEDMDYGEDMKFNFRIKREGIKIIFSPEAIVYWKMRSSLKDIFKQFFRYAKGDALGRMYFYRHIIRFFSLALFLLIIAISAIFTPFALLLFIPLFFLYLYMPCTRICYYFKKEGIIKKILAFLLLPFLLIYIDLAKLFGYVYGIYIRP